MSAPPWHVLLVGGPSGVGKSRLSVPLARHYGVSLSEIDDFQIVLETLTTPLQQPLLHLPRTDWAAFSAYTDEQHLEHFVRVSREVFGPALEAVIANRLESGSPAVLEGDFLLPELAAKFAGDSHVRALFVLEEDEAQLAANYRARDGEDQPLRARSSWLNNEWLRAECERCGVPVLAARPWETGVARGWGYWTGAEGVLGGSVATLFPATVR